jgi:triosephosphate isomerase
MKVLVVFSWPFLDSCIIHIFVYTESMKKQKKLVVGNWKMNPGTLEDAKKIALTVKKSTSNLKKTHVVVCPPSVYLSSLSNMPSKNISLGAQDAFYESVGSFTGEVSFAQLPQFSVSYVIVGHSERRAMGETDEIVNKKVKRVVGAGMTAILCIGEKVHDSHGEYLHFIKQQLIDGLKDISKNSLDRVVVAYEPIWAIGAKEAMKAGDIHEVSIFIKKILRDMYGVMSGDVRVLYGASVSVFNVSEIMQGDFVEGLLVGRESLKAKDFVEIIKAVDSI